MKDAENSKYKTKNALIAYFDILGYKQMLKTNYIPENILINQIERITNEIYQTRKIPIHKAVKWEIFSFSDNYAIVVNYPRNGFIYTLLFLIWILEVIQCEFLSIYGILIRGAITRGEIYTGKNFLFGQGLITAYEMESNLAIYPRIIVDKKIVKYCMNFVRKEFSEPIHFKGITYDVNNVNMENFFELCPMMLLGKVYNSGKISKYKINAYIKKEMDRDLVVIKKDFDSIFYIDFFQYFLYLDRYSDTFNNIFMNKKLKKKKMVDLYINGFAVYMTQYIKTFGQNEYILKKYLWVFAKANEVFNSLDYNDVLSKSYIRELCNIDLNIIQTEDSNLKVLIDLIPESS